MSDGRIIVTGFGPFGEHKINASWESVKLLPEEIEGYKIIKAEVPVAYETVNKIINDLWKEHNPTLVIHVGVSSFTDKFTLETCAYKEGYVRKDIDGNCPKGSEGLSNSLESCIYTGINVKEICDYLNKTKSRKACTSESAGRYLCEYTFYTSLSFDKDRTLFIHVPPLGVPYSAPELAEGILDVIQCALEQIKSQVKTSQSVSS